MTKVIDTTALLIGTSPAIIFWLATYIATTRGHHVEIAAMFLTGILSVIVGIIFVIISIIKRQYWWLVIAAVNLSPLAAYSYLVLIDS